MLALDARGPLSCPTGRGAITLKSNESAKMHPSTFEYLKPTDQQMQDMGLARQAARAYADQLDALLPDGADKTYIMRSLRSLAMWVNISITREADGTPRI